MSRHKGKENQGQYLLNHSKCILHFYSLICRSKCLVIIIPIILSLEMCSVPGNLGMMVVMVMMVVTVMVINDGGSD